MSLLKIGNKKIKNFDFAITHEEQRVGLMNSKWPPTITVFPYKDAAIRRFWMKNTPVPLDIIFCKSGKILYIEVGRPYIDNKFIGPNEPVDLVIEAPAGFCAYNQIKTGSSVKLKYDKNIFIKLLST